MKIIVAGASGLVGAALVPTLRAAGHDVFRLVRRGSSTTDEIAWNPSIGTLEERKLIDVDAVVNLAGENVGAGRWTNRRRGAILRSRVDATRTLVSAMSRMARPPKVLINASAVGFYGDGGDRPLTEESPAGKGFLPEVCCAWEREADAARATGSRVVRLRFGVVLAGHGGALAKMLPLFRLGLGGRLGSGQQWMSWISHADAVRAILHALDHSQCNGPINVVGPEPVTNADFTATLGHVLKRPTVLPVPAWILRLALGAMADEALLGSSRTLPLVLRQSGFVHQHPTLAQAIVAALAPRKL